MKSEGIGNNNYYFVLTILRYYLKKMSYIFRFVMHYIYYLPKEILLIFRKIILNFVLIGLLI